MKICPDCRAPNPHSRFICYHCGERLDKIPDGVPMPGERSYPCANCGAAMRMDAKACPSCGRVPAQMDVVAVTTPVGPSTYNAIESLRSAPYPMEWEVEPLPDGTTLLRRTGWGRADMESGWIVLFLVVPLMLSRFLFWTRFTPYGGVGLNPWQPVAVIVWLALLALVVIVGLAWIFAGKEEIRVGRGFLQYRRRLWGLEKSFRFDGTAVLRVDTYPGDRQLHRRLVITNSRQTRTLDHKALSDPWFLAGTMGALATETPDAPNSLGRFLAHHAGWPFLDAHRHQSFDPSIAPCQSPPVD